MYMIADDAPNVSLHMRGNRAGAALVYTMFPIHAEALTPDDDEVFEHPSLIKCTGDAGTIVVTPWGGGDPVTYPVETGGYAEVMASKVHESSTATGLIRSW